eukprot:CAMPEP_0168574332 /NCGR_PEP_ID=MMETSP0413-20121227/19019_1 /TAXON_ID=136452 /ORGANISM="Filamoeba nolandi, Strain NC-AS-23-1" /LENGTH=295 /DNA_ID=CAMNT_0008607657 /DNA_START=1 /DNA_END=886 /DNA_ORIENTATION=-
MWLINYIKDFFIPPTTSIPVFHGLRVIGFVWVTCIHVLMISDYPLSETDLTQVKDFRMNNPLGLIYGSGTYGVEIFFVLSGYLLAQGLFSQFKTNGKKKSFYGKITPGCPSKRELLMMGQDWPGCPGLLWSTFVDFQTWLFVVPTYALLCSWISRSSQPSTKTEQLKRYSVVLGVALFVLWVVLRAAVFIHEDPYLTVETSAKHVSPNATATMMKKMPHLDWQVEINQKLFDEALEVQYFLSRVYVNPFAKFGALTTGFLVFFLTHSSQPDQATSFQKTLCKYHVPLTILSVLCM